MKKLMVLIATLSLVLLVAGCGKSTTASKSTSGAVASEPGIPDSVIQAELAGKIPASVQSELNESGKLRMGEAVPGYPNGVTPASPDVFTFSASDIAKLKAGHYTAGIVMHTMDAAWPRLQIKGITTTLAKFGIKVVGVTDAKFSPTEQINDLETMIARHPDVIFSIPIDPSESKAYQKVAAAGIKLVFMDNVPPNMTPGKDYVSVVSSNNEGNAIFAMNKLVGLVGNNAEVGTMTLGNFYWSVAVRYDGVKSVLKDHPDIKEYAQTFTDPQKAYDLATNMLTAHPDIKGMWVAWNTPAEEVVAAEKALGKHIPITTCDLGPVSALEMAQGYIQAIGAQMPYDQGVAEAKSAAYALLGKTATPYIEVPTLPVTRTDLVPAYMRVMHEAPPQNVISALEASTIAH